MLKQRVITAVVLLALLLPTLVVTASWPFALFVAVTMAAAGWEWARLNGLPGWPAWGFGAALVFVGASLHAQALSGVAASVWPAGVACAWVLGGSWALRGAAPAWAALPSALRWLLGPVVLLPAGWALLAWKGQGLNALLSVLCLVWVADVAAYFAGRRFGRRKLAPAISPGKSWEGVWGGMAGVLTLAFVWVTWIDPVLAAQHGVSLYGQLQAAWGWPIAGLALLSLAALSVVGDLFESLLKRAAGAKDSSQLLPGHGGVLDRIDALLPVLPAAWALVTLAQRWV